MSGRSREKPLLIYDGDCGFCRHWVEQWQTLTKDRVEYAPSQQVADQFPEISPERFLASVWLVDTDGLVYGGAEAVFRTVAYGPRRRWMLWMYRRVPGFAPLCEWGYRFVARHRPSFSAVTACVLPQRAGSPSYRVASGLFLKLLGVVYLIAFASLWGQIEGLVGSHGIYPVADFLEIVRRQIASPQRYQLLPTLCWLSSSDGFLRFLCGGGVSLSLLLMLDVAPALMAFLLWVFYLSLVTVCHDFLNFQWDALLLEAGFLSIFLAPLSWRPAVSRGAKPSLWVLWLLWWLLFRLVFSSGAVKLISGDPTWRNLTALAYHYQTQPLPNVISWYAQQLPLWFQKASTAVMFLVELGAPLLIFAGRRLRLAGCAAMVALQGLILATGNYCFFNWLTVGLCLLLIEDAAWPAKWLGRLAKDPVAVRRWPVWVIGPVVALVLSLTAVEMSGLFGVEAVWPAPFMRVFDFAAPFRSVNGYGLFAVMTTSRPEVIVEGSRDGILWIPYEFRYKPGDLNRPPSFVAPYQPRLDWQMWFAALGHYQNNPWFVNFCVRLLEGSVPVLSLLKRNPFPQGPPRYIRAVLYDYRFTDFKTRCETGGWWRREYRGFYCPPITLREGKPRFAFRECSGPA